MKTADLVVRDVSYHSFHSVQRLSGFIYDFTTTSQTRNGPYVVEAP